MFKIIWYRRINLDLSYAQVYKHMQSFLADGDRTYAEETKLFLFTYFVMMSDGDDNA